MTLRSSNQNWDSSFRVIGRHETPPGVKERTETHLRVSGRHDMSLEVAGRIEIATGVEGNPKHSWEHLECPRQLQEQQQVLRLLGALSYLWKHRTIRTMSGTTPQGIKFWTLNAVSSGRVINRDTTPTIPIGETDGYKTR